MTGTDRDPAPAGDPGEDGWARGVDRFAAWLAEFSPYYRGLRIPVRVPDDAPARLAYFWRTVGWTPGVSVGWRSPGFPPVPELGRVTADRAFRRWLGACRVHRRGRRLDHATAAAPRIPDLIDVRPPAGKVARRSRADAAGDTGS